MESSKAPPAMLMNLSRPAASSHPTLDPVLASVLFAREARRRDAHGRRGNIVTGCPELDDAALAGGLERGCVVGISAESEEVGLVMGLQFVANLLVAARTRGAGRRPARAVVVTTLPAASLLQTLRAVLVGQARAAGGEDADGLARRCLDDVSISRVFDLEGLSEVLSEIDMACSFSGEVAGDAAPSVTLEEGPVSRAGRSTVNKGEDCTAAKEANDAAPSGAGRGQPDNPSDQNDEEESAHLPPSPRPPPQPSQPPSPALRDLPDMILVTNASTLLSALFTRREDNRPAAHATLHLVGARMRALSRRPAPLPCPAAADADGGDVDDGNGGGGGGGPLILLLNSTTASFSPRRPAAASGAARLDHFEDADGPQQQQDQYRKQRPQQQSYQKPLDPTLRSIFQPAPAPSSGFGHGHGGGGGGGGAISPGGSAAQNRPSFGLVFAQLLDVHMLCTRVPLTKRDAEILARGGGSGGGVDIRSEINMGTGTAGAARYGWVVEVLLDEIGAWEKGWCEGEEGGGGGIEATTTTTATNTSPRRRRRGRSREQRWGAVRVERDARGPGGVGMRVVNAL